MSARRPLKTAKPPPSRWRVTLLELWAGLSEPSRTAAAAAMAGIVAMTAAILWFYSHTTLSGPLGRYLPSNQRHADVTTDTLRLARTPQTSPRLIILGSSTFVQAFTDGRDLQRRIRPLTGENWEVHIIAAAAQSPVAQMSIIEMTLGDREAEALPVVLVMPVGLWRSTWTADRMIDPEELGRAGLRSDWADEEIAHLGGVPAPRTGIFAIDNFRFLLSTERDYLLNLLFGSVPEREAAPFTRGRPRFGRDKVIPEVEERLAASEGQSHIYLGQLERMLVRIADIPGVHPILIEDPLSPEIPELFGLSERKAALDRALQEVAGRHGVQIWHLNDYAGLTGEDFNDDVHLKIGPPQDKVARTTAERFANFVNDEDLP